MSNNRNPAGVPRKTTTYTDHDKWVRATHAVLDAGKDLHEMPAQNQISLGIGGKRYTIDFTRKAISVRKAAPRRNPGGELLAEAVRGLGFGSGMGLAAGIVTPFVVRAMKAAAAANPYLTYYAVPASKGAGWLIKKRESGATVRTVKTKSAAVQVLASLNAKALQRLNPTTDVVFSRDTKRGRRYYVWLVLAARYRQISKAAADKLIVGGAELRARKAASNPPFAGGMKKLAAGGRRRAARGNPDGYSIAMVARKGPRLVLPRVFSTKQEAQTRAKTLRRPFGVRTSIVPVQRNPMEAAAAASAGFHGREPVEAIDVITEEHYHDYLADCGELVSLDILAPDSDHEAIPLEGFNGAHLAMSENRDQLFIEGGDQAVPPEELQKYGIDIATLHEREVLGPLAGVTYYTTKFHLGEEGGKADYTHLFGEEGGLLPVLIYRTRDALLEIAGGSYTIPDEGITN